MKSRPVFRASCTPMRFLYEQDVKLVFLASLVLNVLLVGVFLGRLPRDVGFGRQQRLEQALKDLPEPTQTRLREKFKQMRASGDPLRDQIRLAREETLNILTADPFDEAAYDRHVNQIDDLQLQMFEKDGAGCQGNRQRAAARGTPHVCSNPASPATTPWVRYQSCSESYLDLSAGSTGAFFCLVLGRRLSLRHSY